MSSPLTPIVKIGHRSHPISRRKYGAPFIGLYWAGDRFEKSGLYLWIFKRNVRILPVGKGVFKGGK